MGWLSKLLLVVSSGRTLGIIGLNIPQICDILTAYEKRYPSKISTNYIS